MSRRCIIVCDKTILYFFGVAFVFLSFSFPSDYGAMSQGFSDLINNFEALDPEVYKLFTFQNKEYGKKADTSEIDILDLDTSDILNCFGTLTYMCFQKKIIMYLDSLNRASKINLFGGYLSFIKVGPPTQLAISSAPITEPLLAKNFGNNETALGTVLRVMFEHFVDTHILRITVPVINAKLEARSSQGHCYDFSLNEAAKITANNDTSTEIRENLKAPTCYRGDQSMVALSSALIIKMIALFPTLLKVIAAKAIFGILMGVLSVVLSKMAILPLILSYASKNINQQHANVAPISGSYRQGVNPSSAPHLTLTTDNYETYHPREEGSRIIVNNLERPDYGTTGRHIPTWSEAKTLSRIPGEHQTRKSFLHSSITPRKERGTVNRPQSVARTMVPKYSEMVLNDRNIESVTTARLPTTSIVEKTDIRNNIESSIIPVGATATYGYLDDNAYTLFERTI